MMMKKNDVHIERVPTVIGIVGHYMCDSSEHQMIFTSIRDGKY